MKQRFQTSLLVLIMNDLPSLRFCIKLMILSKGFALFWHQNMLSWHKQAFHAIFGHKLNALPNYIFLGCNSPRWLRQPTNLNTKAITVIGLCLCIKAET